MTRPPAIRLFDRLYLASTGAWLIGSALSWNERRRLIAGRPELYGYEWLVPAGFVLVLIVSLALWWGAGYRQSQVARAGTAFVAVLSAGVLVLTVIGIVNGRSLSLMSTVLQLLSSGLGIAGTLMLFTDGARDWFGEPDTVEIVS